MSGALAVGTVSALALIGLAAPAVAAPSTWYVDAGTGDDGNDCATADTACASIGAAVGKSADGDTIQIAKGTYAEAVTVDKSVTLVGSPNGSIITPPGGAPDGALVIGDTATVDVTVSLLVMQDNTAGPGIWVSGGSTADFADSISRNNAGAGVLVNGGSTVTMRDMLLNGNDAGATVGGASTLTVSGGSKVNDNATAGVDVVEASTVTVQETEVSGNQLYGIALGMDDTGEEAVPSTAHVIDSSVTHTGDPEADDSGVGVLVGNGDADITNSTLSDNGIGLMVLFGHAAVTDGVIAGNRAEGAAVLNLAAVLGGTADNGAALELTGTRITGNSVDGSHACDLLGCGGGLMGIGGTITATAVTIDGNAVGAMIAGGTLTLTDSTVRDNIVPPTESSSFLGAGIAAINFFLGSEQQLPTQVEVSGTTISGNDWGALLLGATGVITRSTIAGNTTLGVASGFPYSDGESQAGLSQGVAALVGPVAQAAAAAGTTSIGDTLESRLADVPAALVDDLPPGAALITGSTIAGNGIDPLDVQGAPTGQIATGPQASVLLAGSIVSGPADVPDCNQDALGDGPGMLDGGYNVVSDDTCSMAADGTSLINTDPQLGPLQDNRGPTATMLPASGSPALNLIPTGTAVGAPGVTGPTGPTLSAGARAALRQATLLADGPDATVLCDTGVLDQRGMPRPQGDNCDAGAVERNVVTVTAGDATMEDGGQLPTVVPSYDGFVGGDGWTDLDTQPTCSADPATGTTTCSGAVDDFYDFAYLPGTLTVLPAIQITTDSLPAGTVGTDYGVTLQATGGTGGPYHWFVADGALPDGLTLDQDTGEIAGTPTASGTFTVQVVAADQFGSSPAKEFSVVIAAAPVTTTSTPTTSSSPVAPTSTVPTTAPSTSSPATSSPTPTTSTVAPTSTSGGLANTGFEAGPGLIAGGSALLLGCGLLLLGRRRRGSGAHAD
jgi:hypothetical protein